MILGFTGTLLGSRPAQTAAIWRFMNGMSPQRVVHGGAPGCDMIAHRIAESLNVDEIEIHPSDKRSPVVWDGMGGGKGSHITIYPPLPPLERNRIIVKRIHGLLACPKLDREEMRSGTWATVRYARELGCPIYIVWSDGRIARDIDPVFT